MQKLLRETLKPELLTVKQTIWFWCAKTDLFIDFRSITLLRSNYNKRSDVSLNRDSAGYA